MNTQARLTDLSVGPDFFDLITRSYARLVGTPLVAEEQGADWLYNDAAFAMLAHNIEPDPRFIYANKAAQTCFESVGRVHHFAFASPFVVSRASTVRVSDRGDRRNSFAPKRCSSLATLFDMAEGVVPSRSDAALKEPVSTVETKTASPAVLSPIPVVQDYNLVCQFVEHISLMNHQERSAYGYS